jgi:putative membrane protein
LWARWIAESINDLLPVAQIGGNFVRAVLLSRVGVAGIVAGASVIVDVTTNFFAQLLFTSLGLALLLSGVRDGAPTASVGWGIALMGAAALGFLIAQRRGMFGFLARRIERLSWTSEWTTLGAGAATLDGVIDDLYHDRRAIASATVWHLLSWLIGAVEIWLALHFFDHPLPLLAVVMMEAVTEAVRSAAFVVPGALGVQEGGYLVVGAWLGLGPDVALAVSVVKRVREVVLGVPGLVAWQLQSVTSRPR